MAHKMEFVKGGSLPTLSKNFDELVGHWAKLDTRYIITPVGFVSDQTGYVLAVHIEQPWKRVFDTGPSDATLGVSTEG